MSNRRHVMEFVSFQLSSITDDHLEPVDSPPRHLHNCMQT